MDEKRYLIEIYLEAKERLTPILQKAVQQLNKVAKAQEDVGNAAKKVDPYLQRQIGIVQQLVDAHIREKKALDAEAASLRESANLRRAESQQANAQAQQLLKTAEARRKEADALQRQADESRKTVDQLRRQARLEAATAAEREKLDVKEIRGIRAAAAARDLSEKAREKEFAAETARMRKEATFLEASNRENAAASRRKEAQLKLEIAQTESRVKAAEDSAAAAVRTAEEQEKAAEATASASAAAAKAADSYRESASKREASSERVSRSIDRESLRLDKLKDRLEETNESSRSASRETTRFAGVLERLGLRTNSTAESLRGLNAEFQGFQLAIIIKYAQSLLSTLIALGAQLVAVAAAAGQAAAGLGAAFGAAAAQAVPVVGVLAAAFARLTAVLKVVKLQNQQQLTGTHDTQTAARRQAGAADQIRNAQQQVADAHRNVAHAVRDLARAQVDASRQEVQAQNDVTQARKDAIRTVQDLLAAERDAQVQLLQAQAQLRGSVQSGDVLGTLAAFDAQSAAQRGVTRARQDAAPVRARGVEGVDAVQQAEQRLTEVRRTNTQQIASAEQQVADAQRQSRRAEQDLARTRVRAAQDVAQETAAVDKLKDSLKLLSPAERQLYRNILQLQETYRRVARPITDILVNAFSGVVDRVNKLLQNPQILRGFRNIAVEVARSIRQATGEAGGARSVGVFELLQREAARNIPTVTRIAINFFRTLRSLVVDALPAFRLLLRYIDGYAGGLRKAVETHPGQLRDFFVQGVRYANQFFKLGLAVVRLLLAISGRGGAAGEGIRTINELTGYVDHLTRRANANAGAIRRFFRSTHDSVKEVLGVLGTLATTMFAAFNPKSIKTLAEFLNQIVIPALGNTIQFMGILVNTFHQFLTLPGVSQLARIGVTLLLFAKGLDIIHHAITNVLQILPNMLKGFGILVPVVDEASGAVTGFELAAGGPVLIAIAAVIAAIVLLDRKFHFLGPTFKWLKGVAKDFFDWLKKAGHSVVKWAEDVWNQGLLKWLRYPFVELGKWLNRVGVFSWIVNAAKTVIGFFTSDQQGGWGALKGFLTSPFRLFYNSVKGIFRLVGDIAKLFVDVLAGRWQSAADDIKDIFKGLLDFVSGGLTSLLDLFGKVIGLGSGLPVIGGKFKGMADKIGDARDAIDKWRASLDKTHDSQGKTDDAVRNSLPHLVTLRQRYEDANDRLGKLKPNTDAYRQAAKKADDASRDYNRALKDTAEKADGARPSVKTLKTNIGQLGDVSATTAQAVADNLNDVLKQVGARTIKLNTRAYRRSGIDEMTRVTGHAATGGALSRAAGLRRRMFGGGIANPYGGAADDHVLYSPMGAPVAALSGTEGIVNRPQMGVIDSALGFANAMGALPWGSLNDLWGSGMRHYAAGGALHWDGHPPLSGAIARAVHMIEQRFPLFVTSTTDHSRLTSSGNVSNHTRGIAADISGPPDVMLAAARWIKSAMGRQLLEGIHNPNLSIKNGRQVPPGFWQEAWAQHINHIHIALTSLAGAIGGAFGQVRTPRVTGPSGPLLDIARGGARRTTRAANRYLERILSRMGGGDPRPMGGDVNVVSAFQRAARAMRANRTERLALFEAGIVESNLHNLPYGDRDSLGALQERTSIYGRAHALNPYASAVRFLTQARAKRPWRGTAGALAQAVQVSQYPGRYDAVRGQAMRYLRTGGPIKGVARPNRVVGGTPLAASLSRAFNPVNTLMESVSSVLEAVARGPLNRSKHLALRIAKAFDKLTDTDGVLDQIAAAVDDIAGRATAALQRRLFRVTRRGPRRVYETVTQQARDQLQTLQSTRTGLVDEQASIQTGLTDAQHALAVAQRRRNKRAEAVARAAIANLRTRQEKVSQELAQNAQDQVEAQEAFQQALLDSVNAAADQQNSAIDRWSRVATALGRHIDPNVVLGAQIDNMRRQIGGLRGVLRRALRTGNLDLATAVRGQINDLNTQIAEAVAQQFQNSIDAVNNAAQAQTTRLDRVARLAQIGGTNYALLGSELRGRGGVLQTQIAGLTGLLAQALSAGNVDQANNLIDQIDELNTQLAENTQAVRDNTDAAFNASTQQINDRFNFAQTVFSGAQGFFQAFGQRTGANTTPQQLGALQGIAGALGTQQGGLKQQLAALLGYSPQETSQLARLAGADLVSYLTSISSTPALEAILARLDPTQQQSFQDLISSLISNATALEQNTQAITELTGNTGQGFSSSFWTAFRKAIFTGEGMLLPQFAMTLPSADVGARVLSTGALMVHVGETVRPATVNRDWRSGEGDTYNLNVTSPTQVLDPVDVNRQLSFLRRTSGR